MKQGRLILGGEPLRLPPVQLKLKKEEKNKMCTKLRFRAHFVFMLKIVFDVNLFTSH